MTRRIAWICIAALSLWSCDSDGSGSAGGLGEAGRGGAAGAGGEAGAGGVGGAGGSGATAGSGGTAGAGGSSGSGGGAGIGGTGGTGPDSGFDVGRSILVDFGDQPAAPAPWGVLGVTNSSFLRLPILDDEGAATNLQFAVDPVFVGLSAGGIEDNTLGLPSEVSVDYFFTGDFAGHDMALNTPADVIFIGLDPTSTYDLSLFCSASTNDGGQGYLGAYTVAGVTKELDASFNDDELVSFEGVSPTPEGNLTLRIEVSPNGSARFAVINALELTNVGP